MSAVRKPTQSQAVQHPAHPKAGPLDVKGATARIIKRYPKILAKLAE